MAFQFDIPCLFAAALFSLSHVLSLFALVHRGNVGPHFDVEAWKELDATFIQQEQQYQRQVWALEVTTGICNAVGWIVFTIPLIQMAWLLSSGGQRQISTHVSIAVLALGGSFLEIVARVMTIGATSAIHWLGSGFFNLDHWTGGDDTAAATGGPDLLGWRTLEVINVVVNGLSAWVDALEWLFLSAILLLVYRSVASQNTTSAWSMRWATLGLCISVLSYVDFSFNVLRFQSWRTFSVLALLVTTLTRLVLMPVWLVWLSRILYVVQLTTGEKIDEASGTREGNNDMEMM